MAQTIGQLSLSLRSIADNNAELQRAIASGDVKVPAGTDPKNDKQLLIAVANQPIDTSPTYTVGAEVSRFQRSTVPAKAPSPAAGAASAPSGGAPTHPWQGPGVRVARGNNITFVPVGAK